MSALYKMNAKPFLSFDTLNINDDENDGRFISKSKAPSPFSVLQVSSTDAVTKSIVDVGTKVVSSYEPSVKVLRPERITLRGHFILLQQWKGVVTHINDSTLTVELQDLTDRNNPKEIAELEKEEIPPADCDFIEVGAVFYWSIGYFEGPGRPRTRESRIRFRRLPGFTEQQKRLAEEKAAMLESIFRGHKS